MEWDEGKNNPIRILFVEDVPSDMEIAMRTLSREKIEFESIRVDTEKEFIDALNSFKPDIIISDYTMPEFDGMRALKISLAMNPYTPFIVLTGSLNEETAVTCIKAGATDYVIKEKIVRLPFAVKDALIQSKTLQQKEMAELALRESEKRFSHAFHSSPACQIITTYPKGKILDVNEAYCKLVGYQQHELINNFTNQLNFWLTQEDRMAAFQEFRQEGRIQRREIKFKTKAGEIRDAIASVEPIEIKGEPCVITFIVDISHIKQTEKELIEAKEKAEESNLLKTHFLANMSHEIRTPMNSILGFVSLLQEMDLSSEEKNYYMSLINKSGKRLLETINDLIEMSKIDAGNLEADLIETNIHEMMEFMFEHFEPQTKEKGLAISIQQQISIAESNLFTDKFKVESILSNLLKNAVKFTNQGSITFGNYLENGNLVFFVKDTGRGIPPDRLAAIFDRFVQADLKLTRSHEGSGLGLTISKAYAEMLGGKIWVVSEVDKGSAFYFSIPHNPVPEKKPVVTSSAPVHYIFKPGTVVLIAEDDYDSFEYLEILLSKYVEKIIHAVSGESAVEAVRQNPEIKLVLMDIKMPGMNGLEATRLIREFNKKIPIIAQTAFALPGDSEEAIEAGCNDCINKPIARKALLNLMGRFL